MTKTTRIIPISTSKNCFHSCAILFCLIFLSLSSVVWGTPGYRPDITRNVGNNYTIAVSGRAYPRFLKIDVWSGPENESKRTLLSIDYCLTPEYDKNSKYIFLRMKPMPPDRATEINDIDKRILANWNEKMDYQKQREEMSQPVDYKKLEDDMKPFYELDSKLSNERYLTLEKAYPIMQQQNWVYYIIDKTGETVIGPLPEKDFLSSKAVDGRKIHWKTARQTAIEYEYGLKGTAIFIYGMLFCIYVLPWLLLLCCIVFVIYIFRRRKRKSHAVFDDHAQ